MNPLKTPFRKELIAPILGLIFGSAVSVALVTARIAWMENLRYGFLIWNLFLAWLPLLFAFWACHEYQNPGRKPWRLLGLVGAWLLFFPNAPYIFTDLIHLTRGFQNHFWVDLMLILPCAFTGLVLWFLSLYLMQSMVVRRLGRWSGWLFVLTAAGLSSVGVCIGRFLRFNSWDVVVRPHRMYREMNAVLDGSFLNGTSIGFLVLFAAFLFIAYVMLYALTHLRQIQWAGARTAAAPDSVSSFP